MTADPGHLFVYGTLRAGFGHALHARICKSAGLVCRTTTPGILYDLGLYPAAVFDPTTPQDVVGELYAMLERSVADSLLRTLDAYEGVGPRGEYERLIITTAHGPRAWAYQLSGPPPATARLIESGDYLAHRET